MFVCSLTHLFIHQVFIVCKALYQWYGFMRPLFSKEKTATAIAGFLCFNCVSILPATCLPLLLIFPLRGKQIPAIAPNQPHAEVAWICKRPKQGNNGLGKVSKWEHTQSACIWPGVWGDSGRPPGPRRAASQRPHLGGWGIRLWLTDMCRSNLQGSRKSL